jgi:hypothetical protein
MYDCIPEIGVGFFEGNAQMGDRLLLFVIHPYLTIRELLGMGTGRSVEITGGLLLARGLLSRTPFLPGGVPRCFARGSSGNLCCDQPLGLAS